MWVIFLLALLAVGAMPLTGCGSAGRTLRVAFVGNTKEGEYQNACAALWQGISDYTKEHAVSASVYEPEDFTAAGFRRAMERAIDEGAEVIVAVGSRSGNAIYDLQSREIHTRFILFDSVPRDGSGEEPDRIRGNTYCIRFNRQEAGFLAGAAAVTEGYTELGFLEGGEEGDARYASGFLQGAEYAGKQKDLSKGSVHIRYSTLPSDAISPSRVTEVSGWFQDGTQLVAASGNGPQFICAQAAEESGGKVITADMNGDLSSQIIAASGIDYAKAAALALDRIRSDELKGGRSNVFGIRDEGVCMKMQDGAFQNFTEDAYQSLLKKLADGTVTVSGELVTEKPEENGITICTVEKK